MSQLIKPFCVEVLTSNAVKRVQKFVYSFGFKNEKSENRIAEFVPPSKFYFYFDGSVLRTTYEPKEELMITYNQFLEMEQNIDTNILSENQKLVKISESPFQKYVVLNDNPESELFDNSFRLNPAFDWRIVIVEGQPHLIPVIKSI